MALDRWYRLQGSPFGGNTATRRDAYGGSTGSQLRRLTEDYNQATRLLRRQARRGDAGAALDAIKLREQATEQGIQTGGIRDRDEYNAGILGRVDAMRQGALDRERAAELNRQHAEEPMAAGPTVPETDAKAGAAMRSRLSGMTGAGLVRAGISGGPEAALPVPGTQGNLSLRRELDTALGQARSPAEIAALRERGGRYGIAPADFDRRANWWERKRKTV